MYPAHVIHPQLLCWTTLTLVQQPSLTASPGNGDIDVSVVQGYHGFLSYNQIDVLVAHELFFQSHQNRSGKKALALVILQDLLYCNSVSLLF